MNTRNRNALAIAALKRSEITQDLPEEAINKLAKSAKFEEFDEPTLLLRVGDKSNCVRYVISGGIVRHINSEAGDFIDIESVGRGEWSSWQGAFVESMIIEAETWSSANATYLAFPYEVVKTVALENPELIVKILNLIAGYLSYALKYIFAGSMGGDDKRLAQLLLLSCSGHSGSTNIQLKMTQTELAKLTGFSRQKVSHILKSFQNKNLIKLGYGMINVLDKEKMGSYL